MFILLLLLSLNVHAAIGGLDHQDMKMCKPMLRATGDTFMRRHDATYLWDREKNKEYRVEPLNLKKVLEGKRWPNDPFLLVLKRYNDNNDQSLLHCLEDLETQMFQKLRLILGAVIEENFLSFMEDSKKSDLVVTSVRIMRFPEENYERIAQKASELKRHSYTSRMMRKRHCAYEAYVFSTLSNTESLSSYAINSEGSHYCCFMREEEIKQFFNSHKQCSIL
ncbi:MAG: hypothetical protein OXC30_01990 [Alphaproteobacteria bacterium]|nr:hypothetical protein [Alphaproteobacteria bacterium]